jgi:hypothetical protein
MKQVNRLLCVSALVSVVLVTVISPAAREHDASAAGSGAPTSLDKTWTTRGQKQFGRLQLVAALEVAKGGSFRAERAGFSDGLPAANSRLQQLR